MMAQAGSSRLDGFTEPRRAPVLFGQCRKRNRGRIRLDPASKLLETRRLGHSVCDWQRPETTAPLSYGVTVRFRVTARDLAVALSVTVSVTT
jgi:hypothetical protein